jgi:hypothetical protein
MVMRCGQGRSVSQSAVGDGEEDTERWDDVLVMCIGSSGIVLSCSRCDDTGSVRVIPLRRRIETSKEKTRHTSL